MTLNLSRRTSNSLESMLHLPFHYVMGMYNTLIKMEKEESKAQNGESSSSPAGFPRGMSFSGPMGNSSVSFR